MKALVFYGIGDIRYEENWPDPGEPGDGEVTVAVSWCAICGTDIEDYRHGGIIPTEKPHPTSGRMAPMVFGHEFVGRVAQTGKNVKGLAIGQKVAVECVVGCGKCYWCEHGEYALCPGMISIGQYSDGGMAEYVNVPCENCIPLPDDADEQLFVTAEPFAVAVRAVRLGRVRLGETVAVVGAGTIGLCGIAAARIAGAERIISVNRGGHRAEVAKQVGATHSVNTTGEGWRERYDELTNGVGADMVLDTGGNIPAIQLAYDITRRQGRCVVASVVKQDLPLPVIDLIMTSKEVIGTNAHTWREEFKWAVQYILDGRFDPSPLLTGKAYIESAFEDGIQRSIHDRNQIKILVTPQEGWV